MVYAVSDRAGNRNQIARTVQVVDTAPPEIFYDPGVYVKCGEDFAPNASAYDRCEGDVTDSIGVSGETMITCASGTHAVTFSASDSHGNMSTETQTVIVEGVPEGFSIETETIAVEPSDRTRRTIGVGEEVNLSLIGSMGSCPITWWMDGDGSLDVQEDFVKFTADDRALTLTIYVGYCAECVLASVQFEVIEPTGVLFENYEGPSGVTPLTWPGHDYISLGYGPRVYVQPDTVNFYNIKLYESDAKTQASGRFVIIYPYPNHVANGPHNIEAYEEGKGSKMFDMDHIDASGGYQPYELETSTATWPIWWSYNIGGGAKKNIELVNQMHTLIGQGDIYATFIITKDQSGASICTGGTAQWIEP
jgi:hypothetical protein